MQRSRLAPATDTRRWWLSGWRAAALLALAVACLAVLPATATTPLHATQASSAPGDSPSAAPASSAEAPSVRGSWVITPDVPDHQFQALAAFAAGGVFITTGSDEPGTGIGQWVADGTDGFVFSYRNFHFGADGTLSHATSVDAQGTFQGDTLTGTATESVADATGAAMGPATTVSFTGQRMIATAP
jgi:hypothetical protein